MIIDNYQSIAEPAEAELVEKRSRFLAFAYPVSSPEEALQYVALLKEKYYDARHVCWAYRIGAEGETTRVNDDGEPSGTAGKPILGQMQSLELSDVMVAVVRYFGGVKLGTGGLIVAYREAARQALLQAEPKECVLYKQMTIAFDYPLMGEVMRYVKDAAADVLEQDFRETCRLIIRIRQGDAPALEERIAQLYGAQLEQPD